MVTLSSCLIWQIISFILPLNEYGWTTLGNISTDRLTGNADFGKKNIFSDEACFDLGGYINKQNCRIWSTENSHAYIEKPMHPKQVTAWCGYLRKWARRGRYSQWRSLSGHVERLFVHKNWRGGYWKYLVSTGRRYVSHSRSYTRCFAPCFWRSHYQPQRWCPWCCGVPSLNTYLCVMPTSQRQLTL